MEILMKFKNDILLGIGLIVLSFILPLFSVGSDLGSFVTSTSTVFAVVAGFFIADAMSNYLRLQTLIAQEDGALTAIANDTEMISGNQTADVYKAIDEYMIAQLNSRTLNHIYLTDKEVERIEIAIDNLKIKPEDSVIFDHILTARELITTCRQEIALAAKKSLTPGHWAILTMLALVVTITVLAMRDGSFLMGLVSALMIVGTQAVLVLLREVDNNYFLEMKLTYESPREVFHSVKQHPFYPYFPEPGYQKPDASGFYRLGKKEGGYELIDVSKIKSIYLNK